MLLKSDYGTTNDNITLLEYPLIIQIIKLLNRIIVTQAEEKSRQSAFRHKSILEKD